MEVVVCALLVSLSLVDATYRNVTAADQLRLFKEATGGPIGVMTLSTGVQVSIEETQSINTRLLLNNLLIETLSSLDRERIPERVVHAKGTGAYGYFQVTHDLSDICKAKIFSQVGKITPLITRMSTVFQQRGGSDLSRETRGMAIKFYTEEGNYDMVGLDVDRFLMKEPFKFHSFVHVFNKNPKTQLQDFNAIWDFLTLNPETLSTFLILFGDRGIPDGYRYMPSFPIHTFELLNEAGDRHYVRFHVLPDAGERTLTTAEAESIQGRDLDYATRDLYNAIERGEYPVWTYSVQVIPFSDIDKVDFDIFDITLRWPVERFPLRPVGKIVLNRNPENQFAEIEQLAFNPGNLVPGIRGVDSLFESRVFSYRDTQLYRLGANFNKIEVNCPFGTKVKNYLRDGRAPVLDNEGESPNYSSNSFNGPRPVLRAEPEPISFYTDPRVTNFEQAGSIYAYSMTEGERCRLVETIVTLLRMTEDFIQERAVNLYKLMHIDLGTRIENGLLTNVTGSYACPRASKQSKLQDYERLLSQQVYNVGRY